MSNLTEMSAATEDKAPHEMWSLTRILNARSIAIVGASKSELHELKLTGRPLKYIRNHGYQGRVVAVNPKYTELDGYPCYPSVADIPGDIEVAALMVAKSRIPSTLEDCGRKGIKAVVIFASGFAELGTEGKKEEEELVLRAHSYGMRVLGPNAAGLINAGNDMVLSFLTAFGQGALPRGSISFASNSGALLSTGVRLAHERGLGFSQLASIGNEADLSLSDFVSAGVADENTRVITAFVESIKDGKGLLQAARQAAEADKPVVILKVGSSERGGKVAASHTGAITGDDRAISAAFRQFGITRVRDLTELIDMAGLLSQFAPPSEPAAAIVSCGSGGAAEMMADLASIHRVQLADFGEELKGELRAILTPFSILVNPIDIAGVTSDLNEEPRLFRACMEHLLRRPDLGIIGVVIPVLPYMIELTHHIVELVKSQPKPIVPAFMGGGDFAACAEILRSNNVPFFPTADQGARGLKLLQDHCAFRARRSASVRSSDPLLPPPVARREKAISILQKHGMKFDTATLHHAAGILELYGLRTPSMRLATSAEEAAQFAEEIGFPVVMKVESPKILHKTEIGGVRLGVRSPDEARTIFGELSRVAAGMVGPAELDGILIQPMVPFHSEVILGSTREASLGHVLAVGLGGVWVELFKDVALRLPAVDREEARRMLEETKAAKLLAGFRGKAPGDVEALAEAVSRFSHLVQDLGDYIDEIELNPIFVLEAGKGVMVGDCLIVLAKGTFGR